MGSGLRRCVWNSTITDEDQTVKGCFRYIGIYPVGIQCRHPESIRIGV